MKKTEDIGQHHKLCTLCSCNVAQTPINDGDNKVFCCIGCLTVFQILSTRNELEDFQNHALFKQALRSGLISNPALVQQIQKNQPKLPEEEFDKLYLEVHDLWCPSCAEVIRLMLGREKGVRHCIVDYTTDLASVEYAPRYLSKDKIFAILEGIGYKASPLQDGGRKAVSFDLYLRLIIAVFFSLNIMMFSYPIYASYFTDDGSESSQIFVWISFFSSLPVLIYSGCPIAKRCWNSMQVGIMGMELLIVMGVAAAFGLSVYELWRGGNHVYFDSMSVIITFVLLGKMMESKAKFSAKDCLIRLARAVPKRGRKRFENGREAFVPVKEIGTGDLVVVFIGEKIVLDGVVVEGAGSCDESLMTGEAMPVKKDIGSFVLGGTILTQGWLAYQVTATEKATALHQIIETVEMGLENKTSYTRVVDPIVQWFVPLVTAIALGTMIGSWLHGAPLESAIMRAVSVLLISCPCAVGIAAPLAESQLLNRLAQLGAIVRNRGCLPFLGKETVCVFDKTGTITEGHFHLLEGLDYLTPQEKKILKGLASQSNHPIACAIAQGIDEPAIKLSSIQEIVGRGIRGDHSGEPYFLGSAKLMRQMGVGIPRNAEHLAVNITTTVYFARNDRLLSSLTLGDRIREGSHQMIKAFSPIKTVLLSGDQEHSVKDVAEQCGFTTYEGECHPLEKRHYLEILREEGNIVSMMGDGINDAPALTAAHVGISVATATDVSIQVSDIMLTTDRLEVIPAIRSVAKKGQKVVYQNLFWAFFYNIIGIGLAVGGYLNPVFSAFAMAISSLIVLFNAKRI